MKNKGIILSNYSYLFNRIAEIIAEARTKVVREINTAQVLAYWEIGREIVEFEQKGKLRAVYGEALIVRLAKDMTERFGKGFTFVARQRRITIVNRHYRIDLVFYNRLLKCFLLIDLKTGELDHADVGQMNFYLNYFRENEKAEGENNPIGLILCAQKDNIFAKYVLGGLNNKVFASKYKLALPSEKELRLELKSIPGMLVKDQD